MKKKSVFTLSILVLSLAIYSCSKTPVVPSNGGTYLDLPATPAQYYQTYSPKLNQIATLARVLFYDNNLSINNALSCGSCHKQALAFSDNVAFSSGFQGMKTLRNTPAIQNVSGGMAIPSFFGNDTSFQSNSLLFWDGRENNVEHLIFRPVTNHIEMGVENSATLPAKLAALPYYGPLFNNAFGTTNITVGEISQAVAVFISSINTGQSRFDQFRNGNLKLSAIEQRGMSLFVNTYNCDQCHQTTGGGSGYFSDNFMDNGLNASYNDKGLGDVTQNISDYGKFKAPRLHNIALTAPYMHDGSLKTLSDVIDFYSTGINNSPNLDFRLKTGQAEIFKHDSVVVTGQSVPMRFNISAEDKAALIAFLNTLTDYQMVTDPKFSNPFKTK